MKPSIRALTAIAVVGMISGCAATDEVYSGADAAEPPTGSRIPASEDREDPNRKTVVDREEIDASGAMTVEEVLRRRVIR